jgi:hypothetical protein
MRRFLLAGVLAALICALQLFAVAAEKKVPAVTRDNFVSLDYQRSGGFTSLKTQIEVQGNEVILEEFPRFGGVGLESGIANGSGLGLFSGQPITTPRPRARLSNNQLDALIRVVNKNKLPALAGKYRQEDLADGLNETLSLTISDENNKDQTFVVENYGNKAPAGFFAVVFYLRQLRMDKFRGTSENTGTNLVDQRNFEALTLETSGGFAGIRAKIEASQRPPQSSIRGDLVFKWSQIIAGRETNQSGSLTGDEQTQLMRLINAANLPALNGRHFRQKNLADGFSEVLTVTLKDGRSYTVSNYGDTAPPEYYPLIQYLNELKNQKFNKPTATQ